MRSKDSIPPDEGSTRAPALENAAGTLGAVRPTRAVRLVRAGWPGRAGRLVRAGWPGRAGRPARAGRLGRAVGPGACWAPVATTAGGASRGPWGGVGYHVPPSLASWSTRHRRPPPGPRA